MKDNVKATYRNPYSFVPSPESVAQEIDRLNEADQMRHYNSAIDHFVDTVRWSRSRGYDKVAFLDFPGFSLLTRANAMLLAKTIEDSGWEVVYDHDGKGEFRPIYFTTTKDNSDG